MFRPYAQATAETFHGIQGNTQNVYTQILKR